MSRDFSAPPTNRNRCRNWCSRARVDRARITPTFTNTKIAERFSREAPIGVWPIERALQEEQEVKHFSTLLGGLSTFAVLAQAADPWADQVINYSAGANANPFYLDPSTTLGSPERFTGEGVFPGVVSMFNPAFGEDELVSIGEGGSLTVRFDEPIVDDPGHAYGVDLIIFGNAGFIDDAFPTGQIKSPASGFGFDPMRVSVSADGVNFFSLGDFTEGLFPAQGYLDSGPFDATPGSILTQFTKPMNPALTQSSFSGLTFSQALALYDGSGGGTPIDISSSGLGAIQYVRIEAIEDQSREFTIEIEAFATVPEPSMFALTVGGLASLAFRRKR